MIPKPSFSSPSLSTVGARTPNYPSRQTLTLHSSTAVDNSYATAGNEPVPVLKDEAPVEQPNDRRNPDSDAALGKSPPLSVSSYDAFQSNQMSLLLDSTNSNPIPIEQDEKEAIDKSNILKGDRTRHAKASGTYTEPGDEEGLPKSVLDGTDGHSAVAQ